jgi:glycosyltransferase involved in cell wall biosynthesis
MRSLMIAPTTPALGGNGLAMRMGLFLEALRRLGEVDLIVAPLAGGAGAPATLARALGVETRVVPVAGREDTHFALISRLRDPGQRLQAMRQYGRSGLAARLSPAVLAEIAAAAGRDYDLVHVGRAYLARAGLAVAGARALSLDVDENDVEALRSQAARRRRLGEAAAASLLAAESEALEREMRRDLPKFPRLFASSAAEAATLRVIAPESAILVAPNAAGAGGRPRGDGRTVAFVGNLGYWPNVEGAAWLLGRVWPRVAARRRAAAPRLWLVGDGCPPELARLARSAGARALGAVDDLAAVYRRATLAVAPLRCGGGTRIKIVEAALARVPVVATPFGAAGLPLRDGRDLWLADGAADFADAVVEALDNGAERARRAESAYRRLVGRHERNNAVRALACQLAGA